MYSRLLFGDALKRMDRLISEGVKVDAVIADVPYGTIDKKYRHTFDEVIPFDKMWKKLNALTVITTPVVLFGVEPFSSKLRLSNIKEFKYDWIWNKNKPCNFFQAKLRPLNIYEIISVFGKFSVANGSINPSIYYPQGLVEVNKKYKNGKTVGGTVVFRKDSKLKHQFYEGREYLRTHKNYPKDIINFKKDKLIHPHQKPLALMEYLVKTYTKEGDLILDFTMGSGTTGVAAVKLNRSFIGIEKKREFFDMAKKRIGNEMENRLSKEKAV